MQLLCKYIMCKMNTNLYIVYSLLYIHTLVHICNARLEMLVASND